MPQLPYRNLELRYRGTQASPGDLIICTRNDHDVEAGEPGRTLANGDLLRIDAVTRQGLLVRRALDADPRTGQRRWTARPFLYAHYREAELGYAVTDHAAQGRTVHTGLAVATPPAPPPTALGVLSAVLDHDGQQHSATQTRNQALADADHLAILHAIWTAETTPAREQHYKALLHAVLPGRDRRPDLGSPGRPRRRTRPGVPGRACSCRRNCLGLFPSAREWSSRGAESADPVRR